MSRIGKNVIENLTTGMYEETRIIFREYIQNSADSIDKAIAEKLISPEEAYIEIEIDPNNRSISIFDNATGVSKDAFIAKLGNVADSDKVIGEDKGFRGIGRLGGLAYCESLVFSTTTTGENVKSIMTWDAKKCVELLHDKTIRCSAEELLEQVISCSEEPCDTDSHYFKVEMRGVNKEADELLDIEGVKDYLSFCAPLPYERFA